MPIRWLRIVWHLAVTEQSLVIQPQLMEQRSVNVSDMDGLADGTKAEFIRLAEDQARRTSHLVAPQATARPMVLVDQATCRWIELNCSQSGEYAE